MASTGEVWKLGHRPALDGLRGIAALLVVLTHAAAFLLPADAPRFVGAGLGVDMFFVLSGFLITTLLLEEHQATGRINIRRFYTRRARRLFPAAFAVLGIWSLVSYVAGVSAREIGRTALVVLTYTTNLYKSDDRDVILGLGHFWTLAVEEQFYLVAPLALALLLRRRISAEWIIGGTLVATVAVVAHRAVLLSTHPSGDVMFRLDVRCDGLLLGVTLGVAWHRGLIRWDAARWGWPALLAFLILALAAPAGTFRGPWSSLTFAASAGLAGAVILAALDSAKGVVGRAMSQPWLCAIGRASYSLYLWHVPVIVALTWLVPEMAPAPAVVTAFVLSLTVAAISRRYIEQPFLTLRKGVDLHRGNTSHAARVETNRRGAGAGQPGPLVGVHRAGS